MRSHRSPAGGGSGSRSAPAADGNSSDSFGFACAAFRSVQVAIENWRQGWSLLERPEHAIEETI